MDIALFLLLLGALLLLLARRLLTAAGLPDGRIVYVDTGALGHKRSSILVDSATGLTGRPDYVVRRGGGWVPIEVKASRSPRRPHESHLLQLAAYCRLVESAYGQRPAYGVLQYQDQGFEIDYTDELEAALLRVLAEMRRSRRRAPDRSHASRRRCWACGYRQVCDQRLA